MISQLLQYSLLTALGAGIVDAKWLTEIPHAPDRWTNKLFDVPTWLVPIEGKLLD